MSETATTCNLRNLTIDAGCTLAREFFFCREKKPMEAKAVRRSFMQMKTASETAVVDLIRDL